MLVQQQWASFGLDTDYRTVKVPNLIWKGSKSELQIPPRTWKLKSEALFAWWLGYKQWWFGFLAGKVPLRYFVQEFVANFDPQAVDRRFRV